MVNSCPKCSSANIEKAIFCSTCGLKLPKSVDSIEKETSSIEIISALDVYKPY